MDRGGISSELILEKILKLIIIIKNHLLVNEKGDVGMAKCFSETRDELSTTCNLKVMSRCLSTPDATSYITASRTMVNIYPAHASRAGQSDRGWCPYICLWQNKILNRTLAIDSPFKTFIVRLLVEFID